MSERVLTVLLVDDEKIDRDAYREMISRRLPYLRVIGEVDNGLNAIKECLEKKPDIVLMDIRMPNMNGLEAIRLMRAEGLDISYVIISALDYFDHAKEAIELGVLGFMVKPVSEVDLIREMQRISMIVERKKTRLIDQLNTLNYKPITREQSMEDLYFVIRAGLPGMVQSVQNIYGINAEDGIVAIMETEGTSSDAITSWMRRRCRLITNILWDGSRIAVVLLQMCDLETLKNSLLPLCSEIQLRFQTKLRFYIGTPYVSLREIYRSFMQAVSMMDACGSVCIYNPEEDYQKKYPYPFDCELKLIEALRNGDPQKSIDLFALMLRDVEQNFTKGSFERLKFLMFDLFIALGRQEIHFENRKATTPMEFSDYRALTDKNQLVEYFQMYIRMLCHYSESIEVPERIRPILDYIYSNYNRDIPLSLLARRFFYSQGYLGRVIKESVGLGYSDLITQLRLDHAVHLLESTNISINEISMHVGYKDANYFSKVFKKAYGMTPQLYRSHAREMVLPGNQGDH